MDEKTRKTEYYQIAKKTREAKTPKSPTLINFTFRICPNTISELKRLTYVRQESPAEVLRELANNYVAMASLPQEND